MCKKGQRNGRMIQCEVCGKECYCPPSGTRKHCGNECRLVALVAAQKARAIVGETKLYRSGKPCLWCGKEVTRVRRRRPNGKFNSPVSGRDKLLYCDKTCGRMHQANGSREWYVAKTIASVIGDILAVVVHSTNCVVCGNLVVRDSAGKTAKTCRGTCRIQYHRLQSASQSRAWYERVKGVKLMPLAARRECRLCGARISASNTSGRGRSVCDECNVKRIGGHEERARVFGCAVEGVDRFRVFERDGWVCQLCGKHVLRKAMRSKETGRLHPRSPSLDHIIPLSKGGPHSESNCQCACLACNIKKGSKIVPSGAFKQEKHDTDVVRLLAKRI